MFEVTLSVLNRRKNGSVTYSIPGLSGVVYFDRRLIADGAEWPDSLPVSLGFDGFKTPDPAKAERMSNRKAKDPVDLAAQIAKAEERAKKAAARLAKLQAKAPAAEQA